jgi:triacylglycerol lipase
MRLWPLLLLFTTACGGGLSSGELTFDPNSPPIDGIVFVHGLNGKGSNWDTMVARFKADGWPEDRLFAGSYKDAEWGCNETNALELADWVNTLKARGAKHIAIVAHSMGGLSSRYYLQRLAGTESVDVVITLGTMHHGLLTACLAPVDVCVWKQVCASGLFLADLNTAPATPGPTRWVSIFSDGDAIVPAQSSHLFGAVNVELQGIGHDGKKGLQFDEGVYGKVKEALNLAPSF